MKKISVLLIIVLGTLATFGQIVNAVDSQMFAHSGKIVGNKNLPIKADIVIEDKDFMEIKRVSKDSITGEFSISVKLPVDDQKYYIDIVHSRFAVRTKVFIFDKDFKPMNYTEYRMDFDY
ncbi:MAG: hypothetical protein Q8880_12375 [Bacteroidota bacterium]|nr:hypothetical protein [Bacteroidota bacterium]